MFTLMAKLLLALQWEQARVPNEWKQNYSVKVFWNGGKTGAEQLGSGWEGSGVWQETSQATENSWGSRKLK